MMMWPQKDCYPDSSQALQSPLRNKEDTPKTNRILHANYNFNKTILIQIIVKEINTQAEVWQNSVF